MHGAELERIESLHFGTRRVQEGQALYRAGTSFSFVYAVRSGTFKVVAPLADGREQVTGFRFSGDMLGFDGLVDGAYATTVIALEDAQACLIPFADLMRLAGEHAALQDDVLRAMSSAILRQYETVAVLAGTRTRGRVAMFIVNMSNALHARGYSKHEFHLRMTRAEIGSYLGMRLESVSRVLSAFEEQGLLEVDRKHIRVVDLPRIAAIAQATG